MKLRILNYGVGASHPLITPLDNINHDLSISDFDAFILDPQRFQEQGASGPSFIRRRTELRQLIQDKGGIVVCILRPSNPIQVQISAAYNVYSYLEEVSSPIANLLGDNAKVGQGSQVVVSRSRHGASTEYLRVLGDKSGFVAYLQISEDQITNLKGKVLAVNSVGYPISIEFVIGEGLLCVVPMSQGVDLEQMGAAIVSTVRSHFGNPAEIDPPPWLAEIVVPGAQDGDDNILRLRRNRDAIESEISVLERKPEELLSYRGLLFGYGKSVLEPAVRSAFRLLGFDVNEPEEYQGDWDIELRESRSGQTAIGEIEGSDGVIDLRKFRQLNHYIGDEELEGRDHKGFLIGNGFRLTNPASPERRAQFSPHALRGVMKRNFCAIPCTELFKAISAILEIAKSDELQARIRASMLATTGVWAFTEEIKVGQKSSEQSNEANSAI